MAFKNRIKTFKRVAARDLLSNPKNFRVHGKEQITAVGTVLRDVGFAGAVLARETENGLMLIDGHLRKGLAGDEKIPVLVLDVTEAEADLILATHDAIGQMADADAEKLNELLAGIETETRELDELLSKFAKEETLDIEGAGEQYEADEKMKFRGWSLPMSQEIAELLNTKLTAYMDEHATCLGMGDNMLRALSS